MRNLLFSVTAADCNIEAIASTGGAGGQNKNRRHTAIRITHRASGAVGFSADEREQGKNKRVAWRRMCESSVFKAWHKRTVAELRTGRSIDDVVEAMMDPKHLRMEVRTHEGWTVVPSVNTEAASSAD